jgi:hypothetical protein
MPGDAAPLAAISDNSDHDGRGEEIEAEKDKG